MEKWESIFQSGTSEQTGKVMENHAKYWKKSGNFRRTLFIILLVIFKWTVYYMIKWIKFSVLKKIKTRMHSSRMHTVRCSGYGGVSQHALGRWGVCPGRGCLPSVCWDTSPLWTEWLTDRCENIIFPQLRLRTVKILENGKKVLEVREFCQSGKVGTMSILFPHRIYV